MMWVQEKLLLQSDLSCRILCRKGVTKQVKEAPGKYFHRQISFWSNERKTIFSKKKKKNTGLILIVQSMAKLLLLR